MDIKQVDGELYWHVYVNCPYCGADLDLVKLYDCSELSDAVWGKGQGKATGMQFDCSKCLQPFELKDVVY